MTAALRLDPGFDAHRRSPVDVDADLDLERERADDLEDDHDDVDVDDAGSATRPAGFRLRPVRTTDRRVENDDWSGDEYIEDDDDDVDAWGFVDGAATAPIGRTIRRGRVHRSRPVTHTRVHGGVTERSAAARAVRPMVRATQGVVVTDAPRLRVVPARRRAARLVGLGFAVVFILMIGAAAFQTQLARRQVELDKVDRAIRNANDDYSRLRQARAELRAPARLATEAAKLGMQPGQQTKFVALDPGVVAEVQRSAGGVFDASSSTDSSMADYTAVKQIVGSAP